VDGFVAVAVACVEIVDDVLCTTREAKFCYSKGKQIFRGKNACQSNTKALFLGSTHKRETRVAVLCKEKSLKLQNILTQKAVRKARNFLLRGS